MVLGRALVGFRSLLASVFLVALFGFGCLSPLSIRMNVLFGWLWLLFFGPAGLRSLFRLGGVSLAVRGPLWCPATPRDGVIPRRVCKWEVPLVSSFIVRQATI